MNLCTDCYQHRLDGPKIKCHASFVSPVTGRTTEPYEMTCREARSREWACGADGRHWADGRKLMHGTTAHKKIMDEVQPYRPLTPDEQHDLTIQVHKEEEEHDRPTIPDIEKHAPEWATHYAMDKDMSWYWYGVKRFGGDEYWSMNSDVVAQHLWPKWTGPWEESLTLIRRK